MTTRNSKVVTTIRCGERTCAQCRWWQDRYYGADTRRCVMFGADLRRCADGAFHRCRACRAAERRAG